MSRSQHDLIILDDGGEIRLGEGAPGLNFTGVRYARHELKAGENDTIALMGGYNEDVVQWYVGEDGRFRTGSGEDIVGTFERFIVNVDEEIILRVSREGVHSQLTIELDGITADTGILKSGNWDGTVDASFNITDPGTTGWALTKAGDIAGTNVYAIGSLKTLSSGDRVEITADGIVLVQSTKFGGDNSLSFAQGNGNVMATIGLDQFSLGLPSTLLIDASSLSNIVLESGAEISLDTLLVDISGSLSVSGTTATVTSGSAAPSSSEPNGSIYLRTGGGSGTTFYVREAGAWVAK
ncbi:MAG: hypothetical protein L0Y80_12065 [Ignavibacteriae bacterium]|nr:hypothetical protein [Ignavibacteriota bacterium]